MKADQAQGRIIHMSLDVTLTPPAGQTLGDTDPAWDIGMGLIREAVGLLKAACEAEGFGVEVEGRQVVY